MKFIAYYRVSTRKQGKSGLGLEAQRSAVLAHMQTQPIADFTEVESGKDDDRPELTQALALARITGATLIVAKLDRLSRNAAFLNTLMDSKQDIVFADMPNADRLVIGIMAQLAQWEREQISKRTREALRAAKARGAVLGGKRTEKLCVSAVGRQRSIATRQARAADRKADVLPYVEQAKAAGKTSLRDIAGYLNQLGITTPRGMEWQAASVRRLVG